MSKTILCAVDSAVPSGHVLQCAARLAEDLHAHLTILYTYRLIKVRSDEAFERKRILEKEAELNFKQLESDVLKAFKIEYDYKSEVGFVSDRIEAHLKHNTVTLLVIDKNLSATNKEMFDDLVESSSVPTVIVPSAA